jgi:hypothetical protein
MFYEKGIPDFTRVMNTNFTTTSTITVTLEESTHNRALIKDLQDLLLIEGQTPGRLRRKSRNDVTELRPMVFR